MKKGEFLASKGLVRLFSSGGVTVKYRVAVFDDEVTGLQKTEEMIRRYAEGRL